MKEAKVRTADLARALHISYQAVRKVLLGGLFSTENNAAAAKLLGVNSDWLATGKGPRFPLSAEAVTAAPPPPGDTFEALTEHEWRFIRNYREIAVDEDAARELFEMVENKAAKMRAMKERWLSKAGINVPPARHAADARKTEIARAALDVTDKLRQQSLMSDQDKDKE